MVKTSKNVFVLNTAQSNTAEENIATEKGQ